MSTRNEPAGGWIDSLKLSHAGLLAPPQLDEAVGVMNAPDQLTLGLVAETVPEPGVAALDAASGRSRTDPATAATPPPSSSCPTRARPVTLHSRIALWAKTSEMRGAICHRISHFAIRYFAPTRFENFLRLLA